MCKQTCESPEMAGDLQVSLKCTKMSRNRGHFLDLNVQLPEKNSATTPPPPPTESGRLLEITQNRPGGIGRVPPPPQTKVLATPLVAGYLIRGEAQMAYN